MFIREIFHSIAGGDEPLSDSRLITARHSSGEITLEVAAATTDPESGAQVPGEASLAVHSGPPVLLFAMVDGAIEVSPLGEMTPGRPFVYLADEKRNAKWPAGIRRLALVNRGDTAVTFRGEVLWDVKPDEVPRRLRRNHLDGHPAPLGANGGNGRPGLSTAFMPPG